MFYTQARKWGDSILLRTIDDSGVSKTQTVEDFRPELYFLDTRGTETPSGFVDMVRNRPLTVQSYDTMRQAADAVDSYSGNGILFGQHNFELQFLSRRFPGELAYDEKKIRVSYLDIEVKSDSGFPEPEDALHPVTAVCHYDSIEDRYYVWTQHHWDPAKSELDPEIVTKIVYEKCDSEVQILQRFLRRWSENYPHILTGWNVEHFDATYLINRMEKVIGKGSSKKLSPFGVVKTKLMTDKYDREYTEVDIYGVSILDYQALYKKFTFKARENYRLNTIAYVELKEEKIDYSEEGSLRNLEETNPQKFIDYNVYDVGLVLRLNDKLKILSMVFQVVYLAKINMEDVFSPVKTWDALIFNHLISEGRVPEIPAPRTKKKYEGAYVKEPRVDRYGYVASFDLASLYPSTIRQWNMCPSTIDSEGSLPYDDYVDEFLNDPENSVVTRAAKARPDLCYCLNGVAFRTDKQGVLPQLVERFYNMRVASKKKMQAAKAETERMKPLLATDKSLQAEYDRQSIIASSMKTLEQAIKVLLNSLYGAAGNIWFRYFDIRIAEGITRNGRGVIVWVETANNKMLNAACGTKAVDYCIAIDTDSNYYDLDALVEKNVSEPVTIEKGVEFLRHACKLIQEKSINPAFARLQKILNCRENVMDMKREKIAYGAFWVAKKKYALDVYDDEGLAYAEPQLTATGLALVQSSTPEPCRDALLEAVKILLRGKDPDRMIRYISQFWEKFRNLPPEDVAETQSVSDVSGEIGPGWTVDKGTLYNSRAALVYNKLITDSGLDKIYQRISGGDKIKILQLKKENPTRGHVVGFLTSFPRELNYEQFLDYRAMFEKSFLRPLEAICQILKVETEEKVNIGGFFF